MTTLDILVYPDQRLRRKAEPVTDFDDALRTLVKDMADTMYEAPGIGLAAVQVNQPVQVIVIDISEEKNDLQVLINPEILSREDEIECEEGCLSVPEIYATVNRAAKIHVAADDEHGNRREFDADGLLAVCVQHEMDHLKGIVFVDYLSRLKQDRIRKRLVKEQKRAGRAA